MLTVSVANLVLAAALLTSNVSGAPTPDASRANGVAAPSLANAPVQALGQTVPVPSLDDAADDPAIWINPSDPAKSLILGTDKKHGLFTYSLDGKQLQSLPVGRLNNVDVRQGVKGLDIAAATNRTTITVDLFVIDASGKVTPALSVPSGFVDPYGVCLYLSRSSGDLFVFACDKGGLVRQWRIDIGQDKRLSAAAVRSFDVGAQSEGMVCDEEAGWFFVGEERAGVWRYPAEPTAEFGRTLIIAAAPLGPLVADVEGLAIARPDAGGPGFLVISSQGDNSFHAIDLAPPHAHRGSFTVNGLAAGVAGASIDAGAVQDTDGIEVYAGPLGPLFPEGLVVVQDGKNAPFPQNFKLISWGDAMRAMKIVAPAKKLPGAPAAASPAASAEGAPR
jgi:3-phytase